MSPSLHQSLLTVRGLDRSMDFYTESIGLEPDEINGGNAEFATDEATFVLEEDFDPEILDAFGLDDPGDERGRGVIVAIEAESPSDVDAVRERSRRPAKQLGWSHGTSIGNDGWRSFPTPTATPWKSRHRGNAT